MNESGVASSVAGPLAEQQISILYVSAYDTGLIMVAKEDLEHTRTTLGNRLRQP